MIVYNNRRMLVEGDPIQYYRTSVPVPLPVRHHYHRLASEQQFSYFNRFEHFSSSPPMYEDATMPGSPQSDSDASISSLDSFIKRDQDKPHRLDIEHEARCQWVSCGISFDSLDQLSAHVGQVHAASGHGGLFYCGWEGCPRNNKGFNARYKMLVHVRTHTNEKPHRCLQCDKAFSRAENLKIHSRSHSGEKPYVCPVPGCHKAYSNSSDRFKHTRTHQVDKPYKCKVQGCPKRYTDPSSLRKHVKTYKHYASEPVVSPSHEDVSSRLVATPSKVSEGENCPCVQHNCCKKGAEVIQLSAYINVSSDANAILEKFGQQPKLFRPYELVDQMDLDLPLDLSTSQRS